MIARRELKDPHEQPYSLTRARQDGQPGPRRCRPSRDGNASQGPPLAYRQLL